MKALWGVFLAVALASGCTTEAWYQGVQRGAEDSCRRQPGSAAEDCMARLNRQNYQEYSNR